MATIPVSEDRKKRLYAHLATTEKTYHGSITGLVDELIDSYLASPIRDLRERETKLKKEISRVEAQVTKLSLKIAFPDKFQGK